MPIYKCDICNYTAKTKSNLNKHLKTKNHKQNEIIFNTSKNKIQIDTSETPHKQEKNQCIYCKSIFYIMKTNTIYLKYGILMAVVLIGYFLLIRLAGQHENYWLRILNGGIVSYGIYAAIKKQKSIEKDSFQYFYGFATGILTGVVATFIFVAFMGIYLFHIEPPFAEMLMSKIAGTGGTEILLLILTIEGVSSSVVLSLAFMQVFKVSRNIPEEPVAA